MRRFRKWLNMRRLSRAIKALNKVHASHISIEISYHTAGAINYARAARGTLREE